MISQTQDTATHSFVLPDQCIDVWHFQQRQSSLPESAYLTILTPAERTRLARIKHADQRQRQLEALAKMRVILGRYLEQTPQQIEFSRGQYGKPYVAGQPVQFNLTHSKDVGMLAVVQTAEVGIDVECWHPLRNRDHLVKRYFATLEQASWSGLDESEKEAAFFRFWTAKEAFMKATGRGLGMGLGQCAFRLQPKPELVLCPAEYGEPDDWLVLPLHNEPEYAASIVIQSGRYQLRHHQWSDQWIG